MDSRYPHEIYPDLESIPDDAKKHAVPLRADAAETLAGMDPADRAKWLSALRSRVMSPAKTAATAQKIADRLGDVLNPVIDKMDESGSDEDNGHLVLGLLIGCRAFYGQFLALEDRIKPALLQMGISEANYDSMTLSANAAGIKCVDLITKLVEAENT